MREVGKWLLAKLSDLGWAWLMFFLPAPFIWFYCESPWAGYRAIGMTVCLVAFVFATVMFFRQQTSPKRKWRYAERQRRERMRAAIAALDAAECEIVGAFFHGGQNTQALPIDDPAVAGLLAKGILIYASRIGRRERSSGGRLGSVFPLTLSPLAAELLRA